MNGSVLIQSLKQLWGIIVLEYKYRGNLPSIESYHSQVKYALPFSGEWVVANGGVTEKTLIPGRYRRKDMRMIL